MMDGQTGNLMCLGITMRLTVDPTWTLLVSACMHTHIVIASLVAVMVILGN